MRLNTLALAVTAALSTGVGSFAHADDSCKSLGAADQVDISRGSPERCLPGVNPLQNQQWHLLNNGQDAFSASGGISGNDLNLWWVHRLGVLGQGINVAVIDDGLEIRHPDLADNVRPGSRNFLNNSNDPTPTIKGDSHGTSVAGIIAAVDNKIGVKGVAPKVKLQGFNYLKSTDIKNILYSMGDSDASRDNRVFSQSFGSTPINNMNGSDLANSQFDALLERKTLSADSSAIYVKSAGNGFLKFSYGGYTYRRSSQYSQPQLPFVNSNADPSRNNFWNTTISAINANGTRSSYSSVGSNVFLSAPGGEYGDQTPAIVTTDLTGCDMGSNSIDSATGNRLHHGALQDPNCDYRGTMNGTSSAAPNAAGSAALLLSAFPELKARDVRDVLARSATRVDPDHPNAVINVGQRQVVILEGWEQNAAGLWFSPTYGFGLIDVNAALKLAANHKPLPPLVKLPWQKVTLNDTAQAAIPDVGSQPTTSSALVTESLKVEGVQVLLNLDHERVTDLLIELVSPSGTRSVLLNPFNGFVGQSIARELGDTPQSGLRNIRLSSNKFYDEESAGQWTLLITDVSSASRQVIRQEVKNGKVVSSRTFNETNNIKDGKLIDWSLRIFGH